MGKRHRNINKTVDDGVKTFSNEEKEIVTEPVVEEVMVEEPEQIQEEVQKEFVVSCNGTLRVRTGPGTQYDIAYELKQDDKVTVLEEKEDWARIDTGLWVMKEFLK